MATTPFATNDRIVSMWRALTEAEITQADAFLAFASRVVRQEIPTIDDRIAAGDLDAELVADVVAAMVLRVMRNPDAIRSRQHAVDDFSETLTYDQAVSGGLLYLDDASRALLAPSGSRAFSVAPSQPECSVDVAERVAANRAWWGR